MESHPTQKRRYRVDHHLEPGPDPLLLLLLHAEPRIAALSGGSAARPFHWMRTASTPAPEPASNEMFP